MIKRKFVYCNGTEEFKAYRSRFPRTIERNAVGFKDTESKTEFIYVEVPDTQLTGATGSELVEYGSYDRRADYRIYQIMKEKANAKEKNGLSMDGGERGPKDQTEVRGPSSDEQKSSASVHKKGGAKLGGKSSVNSPNTPASQA